LDGWTETAKNCIQMTKIWRNVVSVN